MDSNSEVREQVSTLLAQIANLIGVATPSPSRGQTSQAVQPTVQSVSRRDRGLVQTRLNFPTNPTTSSTSTVSAESVGVLAELRSSFGPYRGDDIQRSRFAGRSAQGRRYTPFQNRPWTLNCFCLSGPRDSLTPSTGYKLRLAHNQLGPNIISTSTHLCCNARFYCILIFVTFITFHK